MRRNRQGAINSIVIALLAVIIPAQRTLSQPAPTTAGGSTIRSPAVTVEELIDLRLARPLSRKEEGALRPMHQFKECEQCPEMIVVPEGRSLIGANDGEPGSTSDERPQHEVNFRRPFAVGRFPVTMREWDACVIAKGCNHQPADRSWGRGNQPVIGILWDDAKEYVAWLSRATGRHYRLLSEAEREYVTRAGTMTVYWWGNSFAPSQANCDPELLSASAGDFVAGARPLSVQSFAPNPWGLYQVHGNVYDWVEDCWNENYDGAPSDGSAWLTGNCDRRVLRGGAFSRTAQTARSSARLWSGSPNRLIYMSVRVARTMDR